MNYSLMHFSGEGSRELINYIHDNGWILNVAEVIKCLQLHQVFSSIKVER